MASTSGFVGIISCACCITDSGSTQAGREVVLNTVSRGQVYLGETCRLASGARCHMAPSWQGTEMASLSSCSHWHRYVHVGLSVEMMGGACEWVCGSVDWSIIVVVFILQQSV